MAYSSEWKKRVFETHEIQVLVKPRSSIEWEYSGARLPPGHQYPRGRHASETAPPTAHFKTPEDAEAAGWGEGGSWRCNWRSAGAIGQVKSCR